MYDRLLNYLVMKTVFVGAILEPKMEELLIWTAWFTAIGYLRIFSMLCRDRFEYVSSSIRDVALLIKWEGWNLSFFLFFFFLFFSFLVFKLAHFLAECIDQESLENRGPLVCHCVCEYYHVLVWNSVVPCGLDSAISLSVWGLFHFFLPSRKATFALLLFFESFLTYWPLEILDSASRFFWTRFRLWSSMLFTWRTWPPTGCGSRVRSSCSTLNSSLRSLSSSPLFATMCSFWWGPPQAVLIFFFSISLFSLVVFARSFFFIDRCSPDPAYSCCHHRNIQENIAVQGVPKCPRVYEDQIRGRLRSGDQGV